MGLATACGVVCFALFETEFELEAWVGEGNAVNNRHDVSVGMPCGSDFWVQLLK